MGDSKGKKRSILDASSIIRPRSKRVKIERKPFQFENEASTSSPSTSTAPKKEKNTDHDRAQYYKRGQYLAVRTDDDAFYLCQTAQIVYTNTDVFKVRWLTESRTAGIYFMDYFDVTELDCIICKVKLEKVDHDQFRLVAREKDKIKMSLKEAMEVGDESSAVESEDEEEEPVKQKEKKKVKKESPISKKGKASKKSAAKQSIKKSILKIVGKQKKKAAKAGKPSKEVKSKGDVKKDPNRRLIKNTNVKVWETNPFLDSSDKSPFISTSVHSKLLFRGIHNKDMKLLQTLIKDSDHVASLGEHWSADEWVTPMRLAMRQNNLKAVELLGTAIYQSAKKRVPQPKTLLEIQETGSYNQLSLGVRHVRQIEISRGSREGNKALLKDTIRKSGDDLIDCLEHGVKLETLKKLESKKSESTKSVDIDKRLASSVESKLINAVLFGHRKLAGQLVDLVLSVNSYTDAFNFLHKEVLVFDKQDLRPAIREASVKKKSWYEKVTPVHFAAINPNVKYLTKLMSIAPEYDIPDGKMRRPVHYAAVCEGTGPLQYLLSKGMSPDQCTSQGRTAMHYACSAGRPHNVELLLKRAVTAKKDTDENLLKKFGVGGINRADRNSYTPIFLAIWNGHIDCVKLLIKHGVDLKKPLSAGKNKETALMNACQFGMYDIVKLLISSGALVEQKDKLNRTALIHAITNGHAHIASYLLHLGTNPDQADSSGNTAMHYAAAYGWYHCVKVLLDAGAQPDKPNDWKITPLGAAFLKGHYGLVDMFLELPGVDINFRDEKGMTLLLMSCSSLLDSWLLEQIQYLLDKNVDATIADMNQSNALHFLASNSVLDRSNTEVDPKKVEVCLKITELVIGNGCDPMAINSTGNSPLMCALLNNNTELVQLLVGKGASVSDTVGDKGKNILHVIADHCMTADMGPVLEILIKQEDTKAILISMASQVDAEDCTPFLRACIQYKEAKAVSTPSVVTDSSKPVEDKWYKARQFMVLLIDVLKSDVNATVGPRQAEAKPTEDNEDDDDWSDDEDEEEAPKQHPNYGNQSAVHLLSSATNEPPYVGPDRKVERPALEMILGYSPAVDVKDTNGSTPLLLALANKNLLSFQVLLKAGANVDQVSGCKDHDNAPMVVMAAKGGASLLAFLKELVKGDAKVDVADKHGSTALYYACSTGSLECIQLLLDHGADPNAKNSKMSTPIHAAVQANKGSTDMSTDIEDLLIQRGSTLSATDSDGRLPLHFVFIMSDTKQETLDPIELCTTLTSAMKGEGINTADVNGQTPLHRAAIIGASICCMHLLSKGAKLEMTDSNGNTPLALAVHHKQMSCVLIMIEKDANINLTITEPKVVNKDEKEEKEKPAWTWAVLDKATSDTGNRRFPLIQSVIYHNWQGILYVLLDLIGKFNVPYVSIVEAALKTSKYQLVLTLLKKVSEVSLLKQVNSEGHNLFHILALTSTPGFTEPIMKVAEKLEQCGVPLDSTDANGCTSLIYACINHNCPLVTFMLERVGVKTVSHKDKRERNALAALFWHLDDKVNYKDVMSIAESLIKEGLSLNLLCDYPFLDTSHLDHDVCVDRKARIRLYNTSYDVTKTSPLIKLLYKLDESILGHIASVLTMGASADFADEWGITPVMHAVKVNNIHAIKLLLNHCYRPPTEEEFRKKQEEERKKREEGKSKKKDIRLGQIVQAAVPSDDESSDADMDDDSVDGGSFHDEGDNNNDDEDGDTNEVEVDHHLEVQSDGDVNLDYEKFTKTSSVDLRSVDKEGWNILHHVVAPLKHGSYDDLEMLKVLVDVNTPLDQKDAAGLSPLDYALIRGVPKLSKGLQKCLGKEKENWQTPTFQAVEVSDGITWSSPAPDYQADANSLLKELRKDSMDVDEYKPAVDSQAEGVAKGAGEVFWDSKQSVAYDVLMTKVDVKHGYHGRYNFYKMQIIWMKGKDLYFLFNRWGRIGDGGQHQCTPFPKMEDAVKEFEKVFKQKTSNDWSNYKTFEYHEGKYRLVHQAQKDFKVKLSDVVFNLKSDQVSALSEYVQDFMKELTSVTSLKQAATKAAKKINYSSLDLFKDRHLPFGEIDRDDLVKAYKLLQTIRQHVEDVNNNEDSKKDKETTRIYELIADLSNEYYHLIPQYGLSFEALAPLDDEDTLEEQSRLVGSLMEYEIATKMMTGAQFRLKEMNPLDYVYRSLGCQIKLVDREQAVTQYILKYIHATSAKTKVEAIFSVSRPGQDEALSAAGLQNHLMLWHGSSPENLVSILSRGLLIAPPEVDHTGHMFGKVALGKVKPMTYSESISKAPSGFNSTMGIGRNIPNPKYNVTLPTGAVMPLGKPITRPQDKQRYYSLHYNEYIIYKENQVALRYIVQFK